MIARLSRFLAQSEPSERARLLFALAVTAAAAWIALDAFETQQHSDFGSAWFGAKAMLDGRNPYELIGPGLSFEQWPLLYPAPALVVALPFTLADERSATTAFVALSAFLLAYGSTRKGWHLAPMFLTDAFVSSAKLGQWSILFAAAIFFPRLAALAAAKPQAAVPVILAAPDKRAITWALAGGLVLVAVSFALFPSWPAAWLANVRASENMHPPLLRTGGILLLASLLRWRRPEAWLLLATACMPQAWGWYGTLPLFTIPRSFLESAILALVASAGALAGAALMPSAPGESQFFSWVGTVLVLSVYLPCLALVLRRPNAGPSPAFIAAVAGRRQIAADS